MGKFCTHDEFIKHAFDLKKIQIDKKNERLKKLEESRQSRQTSYKNEFIEKMIDNNHKNLNTEIS